LLANKKAILQIIVKAVHNLIRPDSIIPTLLIFGVYSCITRDSLLLSFITKQAEAIYKVIKKVQCFYVKRQVSNALAIKNKLNTKLVLILSL
jgi:hypothetical protein